MITEIQRLALIKYMYNSAVNQSHQPEPISALSILTFHDSVELFLQLSSEYLNATTNKDTKFMEYWDRIKAKLNGSELSQKEAMRRLNDARGNLKHGGILPSKLNIESFRGSVTGFFEENTPIVFKVEFDQISLVDFVKCTKTREKLKEVNKLIEEGKYDDAIANVALAFYYLIDDYEDRKRSRFGTSPFIFGDSFSFSSSSSLNIENRKLERFIDKVGNSIAAIQDGMKILSLGIDYRSYAKFKMLIPILHKLFSGEYVIYNKQDRHEKISIDDCRFCFEFVLDSALHLQYFDYEVKNNIAENLSQ